MIVKEDQNQARQCYTESLKGAPYPSTREPAKPHPTMDDATQVMSMDERSLVQALIAYQASLDDVSNVDSRGDTSDRGPKPIEELFKLQLKPKLEQWI